MSVKARTYLFTAFEPSGDAHAAPVIATLRTLDPGARIVAFGGERMAAAGAQLIERTAADGTMGVPALSRVRAIHAIAQRVDAWAAANRLSVHIPVDSPAANFPMCARTKRRGAKIVHLVAPQMWAWGPWRIRKLRRLTHHVLCLLPFEEAWFRERGVPATFIGHPVLNTHDEDAAASHSRTAAPEGTPKVLLLPGSRTKEVDANALLLLDAWEAIAREHSAARGLVCFASSIVRERFMSLAGRRLTNGLTEVSGCIRPAAAWCDMAVAVSGTVSLDLTRARKPMIGVYRTGPVAARVGRLLLRAPHRLLPNILAGKRIVPEFVPWSGSSKPILETACRMARDPTWRSEITQSLEAVNRQFDGHDPGCEAARIIVDAASS